MLKSTRVPFWNTLLFKRVPVADVALYKVILVADPQVPMMQANALAVDAQYPIDAE